MIKNERQYKITRAQADRFSESLKEAKAQKHSDPLLRELEVGALTSQLEELHRDLREYEELAEGKRNVIVSSFEQLPKALVQARIASGLSQKELGERLKLKEQQIQRYEATEYAGASLERIREVMTALGVKTEGTLFLPGEVKSLTGLVERLSSINIDAALVKERILPKFFVKSSGKSSKDPIVSVKNAAAIVGRVFRLDSEELLSGTPLVPNWQVAGVARFKLPINANVRAISTYSVYAHYVASIVLKSVHTPVRQLIPSTAKEFRNALASRGESVGFESILNFLWDSGVSVVPLTDAGQFHGACWRVGGRNVIALKQGTRSLSRWTFDLLHEAYHATQAPEESERTVLEVGEWIPGGVANEEEELAGVFAGDVMLSGKSESLAAKCVGRASGAVEYLKNAVRTVSQEENVSVGALANYMAFRLSMQGINWWGAATNLQEKDADPVDITRRVLFKRIDLSKLDEIDREILMSAVRDSETRK